MNISNWPTIWSLIEKAFPNKNERAAYLAKLKRRITGLPNARALQVLEAEIRRLL